MSVDLLRQLIRTIALYEAVDMSKSAADAAVSLLVQQNPKSIRPGGRKDKTTRVYPLSPDFTIDSFKQLLSTTFNTPNVHVIPPGGSHMGFINTSGRFSAIIFSVGDLLPNSPPGTMVPLILGRGANVGEEYENTMVTGLQAIADGLQASVELKQMLAKMGLTPAQMAGAVVRQTKPNPRKLKSSPYDVGVAIADVIIDLPNGGVRYISVKNISGSTFGNHGYAGGFVVSQTPKGISIVPGPGPGDTDSFISALGIDKELAAKGFTNYANRNPGSPSQVITKSGNIDSHVIQGWLASGVGFGYYYVREQPNGSIKVVNIKNAQAARDFVGDVLNVVVRYPQGPKVSKQITAKVETTIGMFAVEIRNSSGKISPNEIKLRILKYNPVNESRLVKERSFRKKVRGILLTEELTKSDKKEIEKLARKMIEKDRSELKKVARKEAEAEIKKALGVSFFGYRGKINKFVVDSIHEEVNKWLKDKATRQEIGEITKDIMIKLYRELSFNSSRTIGRIKI